MCSAARRLLLLSPPRSPHQPSAAPRPPPLHPLSTPISLAGRMPGPPLQSLVKYDTPSLLTTKDKSKKAGKAGGKKLPPVEAKAPLTQTEDILNSILPPRCADAAHRHRSHLSLRRCRAQ